MADKTYRGVTMTPIFQFAQNNGLDEKEFFDFIKSKWGEEGTKGLTLESDVPHGTLEKLFDEYADKKFNEPKEPTEQDSDLVRASKEVNKTGKPVRVNEYLTLEPRSIGGIDTNDNGKIEKDEMADFQKSLDDYAAKNKKGRDDIPVATRRR